MSPISHPRRSAIATALLLGLVGATSASAASYQWTRSGAGSWSDAASWQGGLVPPVGGGVGTELIFGRPASALTSSYTITNNLGGAFALSRLELASNTNTTLTVTQASGSGLSFTGSDARIAVTGVGTHTLANQSGGLGIALGADLGIAMGLGTLAITAPISGSHGITVNGVETTYGAGALTLSGNNTFSGGLTLQSGNLILSGSNPNSTPGGTGPLTINGGVLTASNTLALGRVVLNNDLRLNNGTLSMNGPVTVGNSSIALRNEGASLNLNVALDVQGATVVGGSSGFFPAIGPATLTLGGFGTGGVTSGTLLQTSSLSVLDGSTLNIDNSTSTSGNLANRINDAAAVTLKSGTVSLRSAAAGSSETLGKVAFSGYSTLEAQPGSGATGQAGVLTLTSLDRADRGVLLVRGQNLGNAGVANHGSILVAGAAPALVGGGGGAGTTTVSIVPWAVANYSTTSSTGNANSFATYDAVNGFRALNTATEFATTLGGNATDNVLLSGAQTNNASVTVNSLNLGAGTNLSGSGNIAVTSGAVLYSGTTTASFANSLSFGTAEAVFTTASAINVSGQLTGSGGFTKAGAYSLGLSGDNSGLTGALTISGYAGGNGSRIDVNSAAALPGTGAITVYSAATTSAAGIGVNGTVTINRDIAIRSGSLGLSTLSGPSVATFSGTISGDGGVIINPSGSFGLVEMTGNNSYSGVTRIQAGSLRIHSDANLGNGGAVVMANATNTQGLEIAADWTTSRTINLLNTSAFQTFEHAAVWNGTLTGSGGLAKYGSGSLTINGSGPARGRIDVFEGSLYVNGTIASNVFFDGLVMGGNGRVGDVDFVGVFAPGSASAPLGTFSAASMKLYTGSVISFDLNGDLIAVDNGLTKAVAGDKVMFNFTGFGAPLQAGASYDLMTFGTTTFATSDFAYSGPNAGFAGAFVLTDHALRFEVTAVPEPGSYALLLAGLGVIGAVARRRRT